MKIVLALHGRNAFPPKGHGAIEILAFDLMQRFQARGHKVEVINLKHRRAVLRLLLDRLKGRKPDVIWCHYQRLVPALRRLRPLLTKVVVATNHTPPTDYRIPIRISRVRLAASLTPLTTSDSTPISLWLRAS